MWKCALLVLGCFSLFSAQEALAQISFCATHPEKVACTFSSLYTVTSGNQVGFPQPDPFSAIAASVGSQRMQAGLTRFGYCVHPAFRAALGSQG